MKVLFLFFLTFQWTKDICGLHHLIFENNDYLRDDTVVLDGAGVGSSANEHESHILFPNTAIPLTNDTTLKTSRETTRPSTKTKTLRTSKWSTIWTTEANTRLNNKETILLASEKPVLPTTEKQSLPTTRMITRPTTRKIRESTTRMVTLPTTGHITLPITGKVKMRTTGDMTVLNTEETTLPTTKTPSSSTTEITTGSTTATTTIPLATVYKECAIYRLKGDLKSGQLNSVRFQCSGVNHYRACRLNHNTTASIFLNFTSNVETTKVKTIVRVIPYGIPDLLPLFSHVLINDGDEGLRFLGIEEDACLHRNVDHCHIKSGEVVQYSNAVFINPRYPLERMTIILAIRDDQDRDLACIKFPIEIFQ